MLGLSQGVPICRCLSAHLIEVGRQLLFWRIMAGPVATSPRHALPLIVALPPSTCLQLMEGGNLFQRIYDRCKRRMSYLEILQVGI